MSWGLPNYHIAFLNVAIQRYFIIEQLALVEIAKHISSFYPDAIGLRAAKETTPK